LYCPHSIQVSVRELGRNLIHILDSVSIMFSAKQRVFHYKG
jgi:hypothetical protein